MTTGTPDADMVTGTPAAAACPRPPIAAAAAVGGGTIAAAAGMTVLGPEDIETPAAELA